MRFSIRDILLLTLVVAMAWLLFKRYTQIQRLRQAGSVARAEIAQIDVSIAATNRKLKFAGALNNYFDQFDLIYDASHEAYPDFLARFPAPAPDPGRLVIKRVPVLPDGFASGCERLHFHVPTEYPVYMRFAFIQYKTLREINNTLSSESLTSEELWRKLERYELAKRFEFGSYDVDRLTTLAPFGVKHAIGYQVRIQPGQHQFYCETGLFDKRFSCQVELDGLRLVTLESIWNSSHIPATGSAKSNVDLSTADLILGTCAAGRLDGSATVVLCWISSNDKAENYATLAESGLTTWP